MRQAPVRGISGFLVSCFALATIALWMFAIPILRAQNPELQARLAELKEALFDVQLGPDGKPQKTNLDPNMSDDERHRRGLRGRIREKKIEEYKEYAEQMKSLMQQYVPPEKALLDQAYQQGNVMFGPAGVPNEVRIVITNYVKPQDSVTLVFNKQEKRLLSMNISSYLSDPSDAVKLNVQFSSLPDGTNHVSSMNLDGVSKQLTIAVTNTNYQKL